MASYSKEKLDKLVNLFGEYDKAEHELLQFLHPVAVALGFNDVLSASFDCTADSNENQKKIFLYFVVEGFGHYQATFKERFSVPFEMLALENAQKAITEYLIKEIEEKEKKKREERQKKMDEEDRAAYERLKKKFGGSD